MKKRKLIYHRKEKPGNGITSSTLCAFESLWRKFSLPLSHEDTKIVNPDLNEQKTSICFKNFLDNVQIFRPVITLLLLFSIQIFGQSFSIHKIEPPNWWMGMKHDTLQLMICGENLTGSSVSFEEEKIKIVNVHAVENPSYLFVDVVLPADLNEGNYTIYFKKENESVSVDYPVFKRRNNPDEHKGFSKNDILYLIFPDRFADGDTLNNIIPNPIEEFPRYDLNGRHGGDIQGMIDKLDYLKNLGITALWITPMLENNMYMSYHGYAATDMYKIDPRFGSNELYKKFVDEAHSHGIKIIMDHVSNHIGINHYWTKNLPMPNWFNGTVENHKGANHNKVSIVDVHADPDAEELNSTGWFTNYMPDLNQNNPFLANYIIQNTIWWIEYLGVDGIREDTYPYSDQQFMSRWAKEVLDEYSNFNIVGEVWTGEAAFLAGFQRNSLLPRDYNTNLPAVTDFNLRDAFTKYLKGESGIYIIYETLAKDYLYPDIDNLVTFLDNHDIDRAMFNANNNKEKFKIALTLLMTTRGTPQLFYGTEIGMNGGGHHGRIRAPFPGGFPNFDRNSFTKEGRTKLENELYDYLHKLILIRKENPSLAEGKLTHFTPINNIYIYFKTVDDEETMIIINDNDNSVSTNLEQVQHKLINTSKLKNLFKSEVLDYHLGMDINLDAKQAAIFKLIK
ncbi:MAG: alpha-amylase family glycosyl hydrolase [bacterium]